MTQTIIVYIIITVAFAVTIYSITHKIVATLKSKKPSKCTGCYLKEVCDKSNDC